jgi:fermentation-respiration switch protein FrsA (DUF1100 family)
VSPPPRRGRVLRVLVSAVLLVYVGAAVWLMSQETQIVFRAGRTLGPARPAQPVQQVDIARQDGLRQFAWEMKTASGGSDAPWALFLHGNAGTIASRVNIVRYEQLRALGVNVLAAEYRGFGGLDGVPSEPSLYADARAAYDHLRSRLGVPAERIAIYGWSLGGAVAVDLASKVPLGAVILEGAPASLVAIGQAQYPFFPIRLLMRNPFHAVDRVKAISAPMLFLHSPDDRVIPIGEGRRLFDAAAAAKTFVEVRGGHVNAAEVDAPAFRSSIGKFLHDTRVLTAAAAELAR